MLLRHVGSYFPDFTCDSDVKESTCNAGNQHLIPELGRSPGEGGKAVIYTIRSPWLAILEI